MEINPEQKHPDVSSSGDVAACCAPKVRRTIDWQAAVTWAAALVAVGLLGIPAEGSAHGGWQQRLFMPAQGRVEASSANVLSEHEIEALDQLSPQGQATLLLERSINHFRGANDKITARVESWRGKIKLDDRLNNLFITAINSNDLRVRAAGIEIDLAARNLEKIPATVDRLEHDARFGEQGPRANALWDLALLGNRGVEPERAIRLLLDSIHDGNVNIRYWAVEGLSYLGADETIVPLLDLFRNDPSPMIRERAACGLAQSGMLSEKQRRTAVPGLLDLAADGALDAETHKWVFQALRDITGENLPHDVAAWRNWYQSNANRQWNPVTRDNQ